MTSPPSGGCCEEWANARVVANVKKSGGHKKMSRATALLNFPHLSSETRIVGFVGPAAVTRAWGMSSPDLDRGSPPLTAVLRDGMKPSPSCFVCHPSDAIWRKKLFPRRNNMTWRKQPGRWNVQRNPGAAGCGVVFCRSIRFHSAPRARMLESDLLHASLPLLPADPARDAEGGRDRLAPADAARRHDPPGGGRHLCVAAARLPRAQEGGRDRARGAEPRRRDRGSHADAPARRSVARKRPLDRK